MIWSITPNPALDITYRVKELTYGASHRVESPAVNPGGKGLNVARVLIQMGEDVTVSGLLGGPTGNQISELLEQRSPTIKQEWVRTNTDTRSSITIVDQDATIFNEAGATPNPESWLELTRWMEQSIRPGNVVCLCGSLPGSADSDVFGQLSRTARKAGAIVIVDTSGPGLLAAAPYADLIKPNEHELRAATGKESLEEAVAHMLELGAKSVVVSLGEKGMTLTNADGSWTATLPFRIEGNPTGAGDASVAAWAQFFTTSSPKSPRWEDGLRSAVATSAASVARPTAGEIDPALRSQLLPQVKVAKH